MCVTLDVSSFNATLQSLPLIRLLAPQTTEFGGIVGVFEADEITATALRNRKCE